MNLPNNGRVGNRKKLGLLVLTAIATCLSVGCQQPPKKFVDRWPVLDRQLEAFDVALIISAERTNGKVINLDSASPGYLSDLHRLSSSVPAIDVDYLKGIPKIPGLRIFTNPAVVGKQLKQLRDTELLILVTGSDDSETGMTAAGYPSRRKNPVRIRRP
jgi:hypothetical protein